MKKIYVDYKENKGFVVGLENLYSGEKLFTFIEDEIVKRLPVPENFLLAMLKSNISIIKGDVLYFTKNATIKLDSLLGRYKNVLKVQEFFTETEDVVTNKSEEKQPDDSSVESNAEMGIFIDVANEKIDGKLDIEFAVYGRRFIENTTITNGYLKLNLNKNKCSKMLNLIRQSELINLHDKDHKNDYENIKELLLCNKIDLYIHGKHLNNDIYFFENMKKPVKFNFKAKHLSDPKRLNLNIDFTPMYNFFSKVTADRLSKAASDTWCKLDKDKTTEPVTMKTSCDKCNKNKMPGFRAKVITCESMDELYELLKCDSEELENKIEQQEKGELSKVRDVKYVTNSNGEFKISDTPIASKWYEIGKASNINQVVSLHNLLSVNCENYRSNVNYLFSTIAISSLVNSFDKIEFVQKSETKEVEKEQDRILKPGETTNLQNVIYVGMVSDNLSQLRFSYIDFIPGIETWNKGLDFANRGLNLSEKKLLKFVKKALKERTGDFPDFKPRFVFDPAVIDVYKTKMNVEDLRLKNVKINQ